MQEQVTRKLFLGFMNIHILHHAKKEPFYGTWMMEELREHGYELSAGTLYPMLHGLAKSGVLTVSEKVVEGKVRKYYAITPLGEEVLKQAQAKALELCKEINTME